MVDHSLLQHLLLAAAERVGARLRIGIGLEIRNVLLVVGRWRGLVGL